MGVLAWVVAPVVGGHGGALSLTRALLAGLTVGLVWQFVLVMLLVYRERASLRWLDVRLGRASGGGTADRPCNPGIDPRLR